MTWEVNINGHVNEYLDEHAYAHAQACPAIR